jgi:hypothetical protein
MCPRKRKRKNESSQAEGEKGNALIGEEELDNLKEGSDSMNGI